MVNSLNILVVEDNETMREGLKQTIKNMGHNVYAVDNGLDGVRLFEKLRCDFVITDLKMDDMDGIEVLDKVREIDPNALVMLITGYGTIETAVEAMKKGAFDFITKPFSSDVLKAKVDNAIRIKELDRENKRLRQVTEYYREIESQRYNFNEIIGSSESLRNILKVVEKVAKTDSSVLITGESGTGKELIARAIHYNSHRKDKPFIIVNCGALAEGVLESELFGHEKGAFTGAIKRKVGRFELADGGTIFLDEIGDFSPVIQLKLLRVLQEQTFERVGGESTIKVNVRVISATNKNLQEYIKQGRFREDLYYRLHIVPITVPSLRERLEDMSILIKHFIDKLNKRIGKNVKGFTKKAEDLLKKYNWPGNIRELENIVEQAYVLSSSDIIDVSELPLFIQESNASSLLKVPNGKMPLVDILEKLEKELIEKAYRKANGVKAETARILGIKTSALYYKLEKYGLISSEEVTEQKGE